MWICINVKHIIFPLAKHFQAFTPPSPSESRSVCLDTKWRVTGMLLHSSRSYSDQVAMLWCKSFVQLPKGEMSQANTDTSSSLHLNFKMTNVKLNWISCLPPQFPYPFQQEEQLPFIQQGQSCCLGWVVWTTQNHLMGLRWVEAEIKPKPTQLGPARLVPPSPSTLLPELFLVSIFFCLFFERSAASAHRGCPEGGLSPVPTKVQSRLGGNPELSVIEEKHRPQQFLSCK